MLEGCALRWRLWMYIFGLDFFQRLQIADRSDQIWGVVYSSADFQINPLVSVRLDFNQTLPDRFLLCRFINVCPYTSYILSVAYSLCFPEIPL